VSHRQKILVIKLGAFGDVLQADGALRDLRAAHPHDHLTVLTTPPFRKIFERAPYVDAVLTEPRAPRWRLDKMLALRHQLRAQSFDRVYDLQNSSRTGFYWRWFLREVWWSGAVPGCAACYNPPNRKQIPALERLAVQLQAAGIAPTQTRQPDLGWMADDVRADLAAAGITRDYIVLIPGCSARHPHKRWPYYRELAERLIEQGVAVVTVPGPDELATAHEIPGVVLTGKNAFMNWFELAGVLKGARFVVGNDTGPSHLAAHLGVPGLALFGPHTSAARTSIERERFKALEVPDLAALTVDRVLEELQVQGAA